MTPAFFRRARSVNGAILVIGSQPYKVRVMPVVLSDGVEVTALCDDETSTISIKAQSLPAMRDSLLHELFHAAMTVFRLHDCLKGQSQKTRLASEERIAHTIVPALLGALDQCSPRKRP